MVPQHWRSRLVKELRRQGLPRDYVDRLVDEWSDHASDLILENPSMDAELELESRLGIPEHLAEIATKEFRRRTFAGRHPILSFVISPLLMVIFTTGLMLVLAGLLLDMGGNNVALLNGIGFACTAILPFAPFLLSTLLFVWLGRRAGRRSWSMVACVIIAIAALGFRAENTAKTADHQGRIILYYDFAVGALNRIDLDRLLHAAVPLGLGVWLHWQSSKSRRPELAVS
jgi:hypothetical protein